MVKRILVVVGILLCTTAYLFPQTATLKTYGVDPREAEADTNDIFNLAYNSLQNVGQHTQMYLEGQLTGATLSNPTWTIVQKPSGSNASFGASTNLDDSTTVTIFTPDTVGTYILEFSQGSASAQITINAATYVGYETPPVSCSAVGCHGAKVTEWEQTGHYKIFEEGLNGELGSHYSASCIKCHTTGYDPNASNNGFDDFPFVFPDTLYEGMYDTLVAHYPDAMYRGRIQCESCHGPGSRHYGDTTNFKIAVTLNFEDCAWCHDEGTKHVLPTQWKVSKHAQIPDGQTRAACARCHNGQGFMEYVENGKHELTANLPGNVPISCAVCHDPHDVTNPHQLRTVTDTLENGFAVTNAGLGTLCMNCHHSREDAVSYTNDYLNNLSSHYGPHHGPQADMIEGTNAITFGQNIPSSPHIEEVQDACVGCHMYPETSDSLGNVVLVGSHSFNMSYNGYDNVAPCQGCHGDFGNHFSDKKYYINGNADLDGDGVANGFQIEVQGLLDTLAMHLPPIGSLNVAVADSSVTLVQAQAAYNYLMIESDGSFGIHNPDFTYGLLKASLNAVGVVLAVKPEKTGVPHDFSLAQNYPNPFNPTTTISFSLAKATHVNLTVYNITGQQVKVIVDQDLSIGTHTYNFNATNMASGVYFYRIITPEYTATKKMVLLR